MKEKYEWIRIPMNAIHVGGLGNWNGIAGSINLSLYSWLLNKLEGKEYDKDSNMLRGMSFGAITSKGFIFNTSYPYHIKAIWTDTDAPSYAIRGEEAIVFFIKKREER